MGAKVMADNRQKAREDATAAATALFADPRQSATATDLRAQYENQTGESE